MLDDFGLLRLARAHPFTLSHGEQRRLSVASMLVLGQAAAAAGRADIRPGPRNATMLLDKLETLEPVGRAIVVVSHDMRLVAERARRVLVMVGRGAQLRRLARALFADRRCSSGRTWLAAALGAEPSVSDSPSRCSTLGRCRCQSTRRAPAVSTRRAVVPEAAP